MDGKEATAGAKEADRAETPTPDAVDDPVVAATVEDGLSDLDGGFDGDWYGEDAATFGDRLSGAREAAGMTQKQLAGRLGVKLGTLRNWEDDLNEPRANKLQMVAGLLGVSLTWLLTGRGDGPEGPDERSEISQDVARILSEMRAVRAQIAQSAERLGQLEKRLRAAIRQIA